MTIRRWFEFGSRSDVKQLFLYIVLLSIMDNSICNSGGFDKGKKKRMKKSHWPNFQVIERETSNRALFKNRCFFNHWIISYVYYVLKSVLETIFFIPIWAISYIIDVCLYVSYIINACTEHGHLKTENV